MMLWNFSYSQKQRLRVSARRTGDGGSVPGRKEPRSTQADRGRLAVQARRVYPADAAEMGTGGIEDGIRRYMGRDLPFFYRRIRVSRRGAEGGKI